MQVNESGKVQDLKIIKPNSFHDFRGEYLETFNTEKYRFKDWNGRDVIFVEDDILVSKKGVFCGLHGSNKTWKLIQCLWGEIFEAGVDKRKDSFNYFQWGKFSVIDKKL